MNYAPGNLIDYLKNLSVQEIETFRFELFCLSQQSSSTGIDLYYRIYSID